MHTITTLQSVLSCQQRQTEKPTDRLSKPAGRQTDRQKYWQVEGWGWLTAWEEDGGEKEVYQTLQGTSKGRDWCCKKKKKILARPPSAQKHMHGNNVENKYQHLWIFIPVSLILEVEMTNSCNWRHLALNCLWCFLELKVKDLLLA